MMRRILEKFKVRRYKEVVFVDSENVGYCIPTKVPKNSLVYLFISDQHIIQKLRLNSHIKIINISTIRNLNSTKNIMDFCIIAKLSSMSSIFSSKQRIVLLSKDRGYDAGIKFICRENPKLNIIRYPSSLMSYYGCNKEEEDIRDKMDDEVLELISYHSSMKTLKRDLSKSQKELFIIKKNVNLISMIAVNLEYDIYKHSYIVYKSGQKVYENENREYAFNHYEKIVQEVNVKYSKYETHEKFCMSNKLKIRPYIEEADLKKLPLRDCLIDHLGSYEGEMVYRMYEGTKPN